MPSHDSARLWARGLWKAMTLAPDTWTALMKGERGQTLLRPFVGFFEPEDGWVNACRFEGQARRRR